MPRTYSFFMAGAAIVLVALPVAGIFLPPSLAWGFHFLRFLSPFEINLWFALVVAALVATFHPRFFTVLTTVSKVFARKPWQSTGIVVGTFVAAAVIFRIAVPLLGDSFYIIKHYANVSRGEGFLDPRNEPLATYYFYSLMQLIGTPGYHELLNAFFYGELLLGTGFIVMGSLLVRVLFQQDIHRLLGLLFLVSLPYMQLFFGYVETYSVVLFVLMMYALNGVLVLQGRVHFAVLALLAVLHVLVHYLTFLLLPSFAYIAFQMVRQGRRKEVLVGFTLMGIALLALLACLHWDITHILPAVPYRHYLSTTIDPEFGEAISNAYTIFSRYHGIDLFNYFVLMGLPCGLLLVFPFIQRSQPLSAAPRQLVRFFALAFLPIAGFILIAKFDLGAARDWDVCAGYFLFLSLGALVFVFSREGFAGTERLVILCTLLAFLSSAAMYRVTGSPTAGIKRYRSLMDPRTTSTYAWYSGTLYLASYYHQVGDNASAAALWSQYAIDHPSDPRAYKNIINSLNQIASTTAADIAAVYERWESARPFDDAVRQEHARLLLEIGNKHLEAGRIADAMNCYREGFTLDSLNADLANNIGSLMAQADRPAEAIPYFHLAIRLNPSFAGAYYNLANAYLDTGDKDQGRACMRSAASLGCRDAQELLANSQPGEFAARK